MSEENPTNRSGLSTFLVLLLIFATASLWYFALYEPDSNFIIFGHSTSMENITGEFNAPDPNNENLTTLAFNIEADVVNFDIYYLDSNENDSFQAYWSYEYGVTERYDSNPISISISDDAVNETLTYSIIIENDNDINPNRIEDFNFLLGINSNFDFYGLNSDISVGALHFAAENKTFNELSLSTTTGYQEIELIDVNLTSNVEILTTTGGVSLNFFDLTFLNNGTIFIDTTTGGGDISWVQDIPIGANVNVSIATTTGGYDLLFDFNQEFYRYEGSMETTLGGTDLYIDEENHSVSDAYFQSNNFANDSLDLISIQLDATTGGFDLTVD